MKADLWQVSALQLVGCQPAGDNDIGSQAASLE